MRGVYIVMRDGRAYATMNGVIKGEVVCHLGLQDNGEVSITRLTNQRHSWDK